MRQRASSVIASALTSLRSQNTAEAGATLDGLLTFSERVVSFVKKSGKAAADADDAAVLGTYLGDVATKCSASESNQLYRVYLLRALEQSKLDASAEATLARLKALLGMSDSDASRAFEEAAGPLYKSKLEAVAPAGASAFSAESAAELKALQQQLGLPADVVTRQKAAVYKARLSEKAGGGKIPTEADDESLGSLRTFLELDDGVTEPIHTEVCAASYAGSVKEVMGTTGIILDEYWDGLEKLQARLRLPEHVAEEIYLKEARRKLKEVGDKAVAEMIDALQKEVDKKDGEEAEGARTGARRAARGGHRCARRAPGARPHAPSPRARARSLTAARERAPRNTARAPRRAGKIGVEGGVVSAEALKLVEFARAAKLVVDADGSDICKISLRGLVDPKSLKELYKQFLVECFNGSGDDSEKRLGEAPLLSKILGLDAAEVAGIQSDLGAVIYRKYLSKVLAERQLNDEDREFLVSIQTALGMDGALCERLLSETKKMRVSTMVERMFDASQVTPEAVAGVRDTAEGFGLDLQRDLQLPVSRLVRMLRCEMESAIEAGDVPPDDTTRLQELQEAYGLPEPTVTKELQECIERRCNGHLLQAMSALRRNQPDLVLDETEQLIRFNCLSPFKVTSSAVQPQELQVRAREAVCARRVHARPGGAGWLRARAAPARRARAHARRERRPRPRHAAQEILMRYQSNAMKDGPMDDDAKARIGVLRTALGLAEAAKTS